MLTPVYPKQMLKDIALCVKRGYEMALLENIVLLLIEGKPLPYNCRPHKLTGNFAGHWECHIKPDWLLIYKYDEANRRIIFEATGTHADLF